jgi:site-specific DNA-methyltransferase (adenine-specific)
MPKSASVDWRTPQSLFDPLHEEFDFTIDAAASQANAMLPRYWTEETDAITQPWRGERIWCNPPYGVRALTDFSAKAWLSSRNPGTVAVLLVPVKSDQAWWHSYAMRVEIRFIVGRVHFNGAPSSFPGPLALLVFEADREPRYISWPQTTNQRRLDYE